MSPILSPMTKSLRTHLGPWRWSKCSAAKIKQSFKSGRGNCLYKRQSVMVRSLMPIMVEKKPPEPALKPVSENEQCQLIFGQESFACLIPAQKCSRLWCQRMYKSFQHGKTQTHQVCVTKHMPWSDGTPCTGDGSHVCQAGVCARKTAGPTDGNWSHWSSWTVCSFTCGRGVRSRQRYCSNPRPSNGGRYCQGRDSLVELCNTQQCEKVRDTRQEQCDMLSLSLSKTYKTNYKPDWGSGCQLSCIDPIRSWLNDKKNAVIDGTRCSKLSDDVCVGGKCLPVGCDGKLYGRKKADVCGECGGNGANCKAVTISKYTGITEGYKDIQVIPTNATQINIVQSGSYPYDDVSLCLYDPIRRSYIVSRNMKKRVEIDDWFENSEILISYTGQTSAAEKITIQGKIPHSLLARSYVNHARDNTLIRLNYYQPLNIPQFEWQMKGKLIPYILHVHISTCTYNQYSRL